MTASDDDLKALFESISEVVTLECGSRALHDFYDGEGDLDQQLWARGAELGWLGVGLPEADGGLDMGPQGLGMLYRALGHAAAPGAFIPTLVGAQWLSEVADAEVKVDLLSQVVTGDLTLAIPVSCADDPLPMSGGRVSGLSQALLTSPSASLAIVQVQVDGSAGFALLKLDGEGASLERPAIWDRTRNIAHVRLTDAEPRAVLKDADGALARSLRRHTALAIAADSVGAARGIVEQTIDYMKTRVQFGKPIASFQALKHRAANLMTSIVAAEQLVEQGLEVAEQGDSTADMWAALAKAAATESFLFVADDCVQLHGGVGFTWVFDCHIFLKRALLNLELGGDNRRQRDWAAKRLTDATLAGITTAELTA
jgi:alkylation response protein AidB-like acyl-CoA dehydrogenase